MVTKGHWCRAQLVSVGRSPGISYQKYFLIEMRAPLQVFVLEDVLIPVLVVRDKALLILKVENVWCCVVCSSGMLRSCLCVHCALHTVVGLHNSSYLEEIVFRHFGLPVSPLR